MVDRKIILSSNSLDIFERWHYIADQRIRNLGNSRQNSPLQSLCTGEIKVVLETLIWRIRRNIWRELSIVDFNVSYLIHHANKLGFKFVLKIMPLTYMFLELVEISSLYMINDRLSMLQEIGIYTSHISYIFVYGQISI